MRRLLSKLFLATFLLVLFSGVNLSAMQEINHLQEKVDKLVQQKGLIRKRLSQISKQFETRKLKKHEFFAFREEQKKLNKERRELNRKITQIVNKIDVLKKKIKPKSKVLSYEEQEMIDRQKHHEKLDQYFATLKAEKYFKKEEEKRIERMVNKEIEPEKARLDMLWAKYRKAGENLKKLEEVRREVKQFSPLLPNLSLGARKKLKEIQKDLLEDIEGDIYNLEHRGEGWGDPDWMDDYFQ